MTSPIFEEILARSELSPLFARSALGRAIKRAGLRPEKMTRADVLVALPELERTIAMFFPNGVREIVARLREIGG